jgi:hypothetical protein
LIGCSPQRQQLGGIAKDVRRSGRLDQQDGALAGVDRDHVRYTEQVAGDEAPGQPPLDDVGAVA